MKKKTVLESMKDFLQNVQFFFSIFFSVFYWKRKKTNPPLCPFLCPHFGGFQCRYPPKNLGRNAPIPEDTFWAKNRNLIILTILPNLIPLKECSAVIAWYTSTCASIWGNHIFMKSFKLNVTFLIKVNFFY